MPIFAAESYIMKKEISEKTNLHPRNPHRFGYDFEQLILTYSNLKKFVTVNPNQIQTIDFSNPEAVKALNKALLISEYGIENWDIPQNYLCPPIPGRADYIHYIADLLAKTNDNQIPEGVTTCGLDIGTGSNGIYPIIGNSVYGWSFVATDIDPKALENFANIIESNPDLHETISLQQQLNPRFIFKDILLPEDKFAFTICNPPFHASAEEAAKSTQRKNTNLHGKKTTALNFGGQNAELWCEGGELAFLTQMIYESAKYPMQVLWFTTLVSKESNLANLYKILNKVNAAQIQTIDMAQGQKNSRFIAWSFLSENQRKSWKF